MTSRTYCSFCWAARRRASMAAAVRSGVALTLWPPARLSVWMTYLDQNEVKTLPQRAGGVVAEQDLGKGVELPRVQRPISEGLIGDNRHEVGLGDALGQSREVHRCEPRVQCYPEPVITRDTEPGLRQRVDQVGLGFPDVHAHPSGTRHRRPFNPTDERAADRTEHPDRPATYGRVLESMARTESFRGSVHALAGRPMCHFLYRTAGSDGWSAAGDAVDAVNCDQIVFDDVHNAVPAGVQAMGVSPAE